MLRKQFKSLYVHFSQTYLHDEQDYNSYIQETTEKHRLMVGRGIEYVPISIKTELALSVKLVMKKKKQKPYFEQKLEKEDYPQTLEELIKFCHKD